MRTSSAEQFFAKVPLFAGLPKRYLRRLGSLVSVVDVEAGRVFIREGETGREFFVVMSGDAEIRKGDQVVAFGDPTSSSARSPCCSTGRALRRWWPAPT